MESGIDRRVNLQTAIAALRRIVEVYSNAPEAPLAAWTLGNLLDQAGDELGAASAYALYRRLSPGGDFAEDALAREVESALAQGNLEQSARLIAQYENEFPSGRSLEEFLSELARRVARPAGLDGADTDLTSDPAHAEHLLRDGRFAPWANWQALALHDNVAFLGTRSTPFTRDALGRNVEGDYFHLYLLVLFQKYRMSAMFGETMRRDR